MEKVTATTTKNPAQPGYGALSGIITSSIDSFLASFQSTLREVAKGATPEMLVGFVTIADRFATDCSERYAATLRELTSKPDVRDTAEAVLARLIRNRCFEPLDIILEEYVTYLAQLNLDIQQALANLGDSRLRDLAIRNADGWVVQRRFKLPSAAKVAALVKIVEYLNRTEALPAELLDYGTSKLSGAEPDLDLQRSFISSMSAAIQDRLREAISVIESIDAVRQRKWEHHRASEDAAISAIASIASMRRDTTKGGVGALLMAFLLTAPIGWVSLLDAPDLYLGGAAAISGVAALFFFYRSIVLFTRRSNS